MFDQRYSLKELIKSMINENNISLETMNDEDKYNTLKILIERHCPLETLKTKIEDAKCTKEMLNEFFISDDEEVTSLLFIAITNELFRISDYLINIGCDINYCNNGHSLIQLLKMKNLLSPKIMAYLLSKNLNTKVFKDELNQIDFKTAKILILYNNNKFILSLLSMYKEHHEIGKISFESFLKNEKKNLIIPYKWYKDAILNENYHHIDFFKKFDQDIVFEKKIINIWWSVNQRYLPQEQKKFVIFFKKCKYHNISITLDPNLINRALNSIIKTKRKQIKMDMYLNNWNALSLYLQENSYLLDDINTEYFDTLSLGIFNGIPINHLNEIIHYFSYTVFDYIIPYDMMNDNISPVTLSIVLNRFDICMHLLSLGADINYKMMDRSGTNNAILECLCKHKKLNVNTLNFIFNKLRDEYHYINKIQISMSLLKTVIKNESKDVILLLTKEYQKADRFKNSWYRYALTYQKLELIDHLFYQDPKSPRYKVWSIMFEIQKFSNSLKLMFDLKKITKIEDLSISIIFYLKSYKKKLLKIKNKNKN